jgi:lysophospholipase L1-like esterase
MIGRVLISLLAFALAASAAPPDPPGHWVGTWACAPQLAEPANCPPAPGLAGSTLREIVRASIGGRKVRLRLSNAFGDAAVSLASVHLADSAGGGEIRRGSDRALAFGGAPAVTIPPGRAVTSDASDFDLAPLSDVAITIQFRNAPRGVTAHPGSRTTSFLQRGDFVSAPALPDPARIDHWYFIEGVDVFAEDASAGAVVILGDSITDGRGSTTNGNDRWPDLLARRVQADPAMPRVAVLNEGIGGNCLIRGGLGPTALARFDRDVLAQAGARWLIVFEGVNDIGGSVAARASSERPSIASDIIEAYKLFTSRAHARGLRVAGATITAFGGFSRYFTPESEAARQQINHWIRTSGKFDAVIDFDAATRDPGDPSRLAAGYDCGDHLHLNPAGYDRMARAVDLRLFR